MGADRILVASLTSRKGYGTKHQRERRCWAPMVERGEVECRRCGRLIQPGTPWDLGHNDYDRSLPAEPEHRKCNRATASRLTRRKSVPPSRKW